MTLAPLPFERSFLAWMRERGMRWEEGRLGGETSGSNCRLLRLLPAGETRRIVIAFHGAGNDALYAWIALFRDLLEAGSEIRTFDLPGHGRGGESLFDLPGARAAIDEVLAGCANDGDDRVPVHTVGVSLGGSLLLDALARHSGEPASATAIVAPLRIHLSPSTIAPELTHRIFRHLWNERTLYGWTGLIPSFGRFKRDIYPLRLAATPPAGTFGYVDVLNEVLRESGLREDASRIRVPVLLIYGERDRIVPIWEGELLAGAIEGSELLRLPQGTHLSTPLAERVRSRTLEWMMEHE